MTEKYDDVYALFIELADRSSELSDEQHLGVMEAFNCFAEAGRPTWSGSPPDDRPTAEDLLRRTVSALAGLAEGTLDGAHALAFARAHALLFSSLAAG